ncbi:MAG TPA: response regulator [Thermodesulfobacteriota bacterium]|nr:response regulator [Thermodesulfobacteriota bacterium]
MCKDRLAKILIVEDEIIVALDIKYILENLGYRVLDIATSGERAIKKAEETTPDLVLMDIGLSEGMDGVDSARKIRVSFDIPVVYLSAYSDKETLERADAAASYGYLHKPFAERDLHTAIQAALHKHMEERKIREKEAFNAH